MYCGQGMTSNEARIEITEGEGWKWFNVGFGHVIQNKPHGYPQDEDSLLVRAYEMGRMFAVICKQKLSSDQLKVLPLNGEFFRPQYAKLFAENYQEFF